ncbi:MAG: type II secretion system protein [Verrucomicrobiales bacterium]
MQYPTSLRKRAHLHGFTLIEVTLVIATILGLVGVTFLGATSYKKGANRALCILQVANVQKAMRSYCNLHELQSGQPIEDLKHRLIVKSEFFAKAPFCPSGGTYVFHKDEVPHIGTLFMRCSLVDHTPTDFQGW